MYFLATEGLSEGEDDGFRLLMMITRIVKTFYGAKLRVYQSFIFDRMEAHGGN